MAGPPPDWQLPPGVNRGLWDYLHAPQVARGYDAGLAGSSLFALDVPFVREFCPTPGNLIDLGCGTGRLLLALAPLGYRVLGVDLSAEMLAVARARAGAAGLDVPLLRANLARLDCLAAGSFDYAACLFSTLGMLVGGAARRDAVAHAYRLLAPGGCFVLHVHNRWFNLRTPAGRAWLLRDLAGLREPGLEPGDRTMPVHQGVAGLTLHLFRRGEVVRLLSGAGFRLLEVRPISLAADGRLRAPGWLPGLRAYGYLVAARK